MKALEALGIEPGKGKYHEEVIYSLALIYSCLDDALSAYLDPHRLSLGKFNILMVIKHRGRQEWIPQVEISKHLIVTPSNMTKLLDKLEKAQLVTRSALAGDRRVNIIRITRKGSELLDKVWPGYTKLLKDLMEGLKLPQQKELAQLLTAWIDRLKRP